MKQEDLKVILLSTLHNYNMTLQTSESGKTDRDAYHRLVDASTLAGYGVLEKRYDSRYIVGNLDIAGKSQRVFTLFRDPTTGKLDVDLSLDHLGKLEEGGEQKIFMTIFKLLAVATSVVIPSSIAGLTLEESPVIQHLKNQAG